MSATQYAASLVGLGLALVAVGFCGGLAVARPNMRHQQLGLLVRRRDGHPGRRVFRMADVATCPRKGSVR